VIRIVGHRGACGHAPENTLASIRRACEMGVDAVEFDVRLTSDGHAVLLHDATLDRTTSGAGPVAAYTLAQVRALDAGAWFGAAFAGERVPTLAEALGEGDQRPTTKDQRRGDGATGRWGDGATPGAGQTRWLVELKRGEEQPERFVEKVLAVIAATGTATGVRLISFDEELLAAARDQAPGIPRGIISGTDAEGLLAMGERLECVSVHAGRRILTPEPVAAAHATGLWVNAWTLNEREAIVSAAGLGVDEITTDLPDVALAVLGSAKQDTP
jgi:glycerophosphoryl diester phosphodiesterase